MFHSEQPLGSREGRVRHRPRRSLLERLSTVFYNRTRDCTDDRNPPSARIHRLEDIFFEGRQWHAYQMEITCPITGESTLGKCLWVGPGLENILFQRNGFPNPRDSKRQRLEPGSILRSDSSTIHGGSSGNQPRASSQVPVSTQGYFTEQLLCPVQQYAAMSIDETDAMADEGMPEPYVPEPARHHLGR